MRNRNIKTKTARSALPPWREPYWARLANRIAVGYRVLTQGEGTWIGRRQGEDGKKQYRSFGTILDSKDGKAFDIASKLVLAWADGLEKGVSNEVLTVADVCKTYRSKKSPTGHVNAQPRFAKIIYGTDFGNIKLEKLRKHNIEKWLDDLVGEHDDPEVLRRRRDTANRDLTALRAALNWAYESDLVGSDKQWKHVRPFKSVDKSRAVRLDKQQIDALLAACKPELAALVKGLLLTAARVGELAAATVGDFNRKQGILHIQQGKTGSRDVVLSDEGVAFFTAQAKGKLPKAPLLPHNGGHWKKIAWCTEFKKAAKVAGLPTDRDRIHNVTLYTLRHTAISNLVYSSGLDSAVIAENAGTSVEMIKKNYLKVIQEQTRAGLNRSKIL